MMRAKQYQAVLLGAVRPRQPAQNDRAHRIRMKEMVLRLKDTVCVT